MIYCSVFLKKNEREIQLFECDIAITLIKQIPRYNR